VPDPTAADPGADAVAAVVLAGGRAARMGGGAKPQLQVGGRTMLDAVLAAVPAARPRVVVGPPQPVPADVVLVREDPPGGGPVPALRAGLAAVPTGVVVVLAADLPFLTPELVADLVADLAAHPTADGVLVVDATGRDQYLLGAWRTASLRTRVAGAGAPTSLRALLAGLQVSRFAAPAPAGRPAPWTDCDTPADLDRARAAAGVPPTPPG
jgi:molybdopterin-guanine dinucleotide biosynthesis protein A